MHICLQGVSEVSEMKIDNFVNILASYRSRASMQDSSQNASGWRFKNIVFIRQCENQNTANTVIHKMMPSAKI